MEQKHSKCVHGKVDPNYWLNTDDVDTIEWDCKIPWENVEDNMHLQNMKDTHSERHILKGGKFSLLVRIDQRGLSVYVGLNEMSTLSPDYCLNCRFSISLRYNDAEQDNGYRLRELSGDSMIFKRQNEQDGRVVDYVDLGRNAALTPYELRQSKQELVDTDGCFTVHCLLRALPIISSPPPDHDSKQATGMVGLENLGATCYLNALLQMLYHINAFRSAVFAIPFEGENFESSTTLAMQSIFNKLQCDHRAVSTRDLTRAFGWDSLEAFQQQDVQEMLRVLLDKMEDCMRGGGAAVEGVVKGLFAGKIKSYVRCVNIEYESAREEEFYDIQLDVKGCRGVYESFRKYSEKELLAGENQYDAGEDDEGKPRGKQDAEKGVVFTELPPVLTIHLKRFEFDMQQMGFAKIHDSYEFDLRLELDQFVEPEQQEETRGTRPKNNFVLHSVLIHAGDVYGGHYYAYIRPSSGEFWQNVAEVDRDVTTAMATGPVEGGAAGGFGGKWFKFDDDYVTCVDRRQAVEGSYGSKRNYHSAYMLVYLRETEAARTMAEVEIPSDLSARLEEEYQRHDEAARMRMTQRMFQDVSFLLREDLDAFCEYQQNYDFFDPESVRTMKVMKRSSLTGYLTAFADLLAVRVDRVRLWRVERAERAERSDAYRIQGYCDLRSMRDEVLSVPVDCLFYVEVGPAMEDLQFEKKLSNLENFQLEWLKKGRKALEDVEGVREYDSMEGCGAGRGNCPLRELLDVDMRAVLREEENRMSSFLTKALLDSAVYRDQEEKSVMLILKTLNVDGQGKLSSTTVMDTVGAVSVDGSKVTFDIIRNHCHKTAVQNIQRQMQRGELTEDQGRALNELWARGNLVRLVDPVHVESISRSLEGLPITNASHSLQCGDVLCLIPAHPDSSTHGDDNPYINELMSFLRSVVLQVSLKVKHLVKLQVSHGDILNRRTGLWSLAREVLLGLTGEDSSRQEVLPEHGILVEANEEFSKLQLQEAIDQKLQFGDPSRLRVGVLTAGGRSGASSKMFSTLLEDYFVRRIYDEELLVEALPFPRRSMSAADTIASEGGDGCKYYEVYLCGARLKDIRKQWLEGVVYPLAAELYKQQVEALVEENVGCAPDVFQLDRLSTDLPWGEGVLAVTDEFILSGKCYTCLPLPPSGAPILVHDVVQQFRRYMGILLSSPSDQSSGTADSFARKRSAEGAGLHEGRRAEDQAGEVECMQPLEAECAAMDVTQSVDLVSYEDSLSNLSRQLSEVLVCAENRTSGRRDDARVVLFSTMRGKISTIYRAEQSASDIPKSWVDSSIHDQMSKMISISPLCAQLISSEELQFMRAAHPSVRSLPVSVFSFEYTMNTAKSHARLCETEAGPLLCYVREDDTHETLVARLSAMVGGGTKTDWESLRLAVVTARSYAPYFIPRNAVQQPAQQQETEEEVVAGPERSVWNLFEKHYTDFTKAEGLLNMSLPLDPGELPLLGLQQPTATTEQAGQGGRALLSGGVRRVNSGIKIN